MKPNHKIVVIKIQESNTKPVSAEATTTPVSRTFGASVMHWGVVYESTSMKGRNNDANHAGTDSESHFLATNYSTENYKPETDHYR